MNWVCAHNGILISESVNFFTSLVSGLFLWLWVLSWVIQDIREVENVVSAHIVLESMHARSLATNTLVWGKDVSVHHYTLGHVRSIHDWEVLKMSALSICESVATHFLCWVSLHVSVHSWLRDLIQILALAGKLWETLVLVIHCEVLWTWLMSSN